MITVNKWSDSDIQFLRDNWKTLCNIAIGKKLNRTANAVGIKGTKLNLNHKKDYTEDNLYYEKSIAGEDYHMYIKMCSVAAKMKEFKDNFDLTGIHKFIIKELWVKGRNAKDTRKISGKVISKSENIVTLQLEHYKESFTVSSFFTGEISVKG